MDGLLRRRELRAFVSQGGQVNPLEQSLPSSEQDRHDGDVQLIDEARTKILLDGVGPTTDLHVHPVCCLARLVKRLMNAACDEMGLSPHQPFQFMSGQGPRIGPNMFLPRIHAPTFLEPRAAKSSSIPVAPPSFPCI